MTQTSDPDISKSVTRLPPLKKHKGEDSVVDKTNETPAPALERKITDPDKKVAQTQNSYIVRKINSKRKI